MDQKRIGPAENRARSGDTFNNTNPATAALSVAGNGIAVFPVGDGKQPLGAGGFKSATTDSDAVAGRWQQFPRALVAVATGKEAVRLIRAEVPAAGSHGANQWDGGSNTTSTKDRGQEYQLRRLKRDRPDLAKDVIDGTKSLNAAAIEAGFRRRKVQVEPTPEAVQRMLDKHLPDYQVVPKAGGVR